MTQHPIPEDALDSDIAILAKKGAGKTYTAKGIVERLLDDGARVLVLDPLSTWWGLKSSADGESAGYPIAVFGGPHGDMELTESMAKPLAEVIAKNNLPAVMDVASMKKAEQQRFVRDLLETLFQKNRDPLTIVLEEAHVFAPQSVAGAEASAFHEVDRIARMGRAFGFRLISVTQRSSRLHKDVLTQAATVIALQTQHHLDQKPILDWFTANADKAFAKTVETNLANLKVGEAFVGATDQDFFERVQFPTITTLDSSATPKLGEKRIEPKTLAEVDLSSVRAALEVPEKEPDATKAKTVRDESAIKEARREGYREGREAGLSEGRKLGWQDAMETIVRAAREAAPSIAPQAPKSEPEVKARPTSKPATPDGLTAPQMKILKAISFWNGLWVGSPTRVQVAAAARYSPRSGGFGNLLGSLRTAGFIDYPEPGAVCLTDAGRAIAPSSAGGSVRDRLGSVLSAPQQKIVDALASEDEITRDMLGQLTDYSPTSGGFGNLLGSLRSLGIVEYPRKGEVRLSDWVREGA